MNDLNNILELYRLENSANQRTLMKAYALEDAALAEKREAVAKEIIALQDARADIEKQEAAKKAELVSICDRIKDVIEKRRSLENGPQVQSEFAEAAE